MADTAVTSEHFDNDHERFAVELCRLPHAAEATLVQYRRTRHGPLHLERWERVAVLAVDHVPPSDLTRLLDLTTRYKTAARYAAAGELGQYVAIDHVGTGMRVSLIERALTPRGVVTNILEQREFSDLESALVESNEYATELRVRATEATRETWSAMIAQAAQRAKELENAEASRSEWEQLEQIADAERDPDAP